MTVHRIVEERAAAQGDHVAIADRGVTLSYRELNQRANAVARQLIASGFSRGSIATVRLPRSAGTAIVLLGILKAGGTYALVDGDTGRELSWPAGVSFVHKSGAEQLRYLAVDVTAALDQPIRSSANLPIVSRPGDVACVLPAVGNAPLVLVPHSTITALQSRPAPPFAEWGGEPGALDLWVGLMTGSTVTLDGQGLPAAA